MKKIPTLFKRIYDDSGSVSVVTNEVIPGFEWVLDGLGVATVKYDGSCCAIIDGMLFKRYDAKKGKNPPAGAIPCQPEPDPITGHWPHWVKVSVNNPSDKWFLEAMYLNIEQSKCIRGDRLIDGTYEAVGKHFNGNHYDLNYDILVPHGNAIIHDFPRDFIGMGNFLSVALIEGVVFWLHGEPRCKIKRSDFGYSWPRR